MKIDATFGFFVVLLFRVEVVDQQSAAPSITQIPTKKGKGEENYLQVLIASCQFHRKLRDTLMRYLTMLIEHVL